MSSSTKFAFVLFLCLLGFSLAAQSVFSGRAMAVNHKSANAGFKSERTTILPVNATAAFPGGNAELLASLYNTITYPEAAVENAVEGMVVVRLHLDADGRVAERKIVRSLGFGCDAAALEAIATLPSWIPARKAGQNTASVVYLPLKFSLR
jgi:TonB family protein